MIQTLTLRNFKSFSEPKGHKGPWEGATIGFGGLSLIIGTNASGKSNIRDGLRFIHGISRGYTLSEIIGEKYVEGGVLQWKGIRGGVRETVTRDGDVTDAQFTVAVQTKIADEDGGGDACYSITIDVGYKGQPPAVVAESLKLSRYPEPTLMIKELSGLGDVRVLVQHNTQTKIRPLIVLRSDQPTISQLTQLKERQVGGSRFSIDLLYKVATDCRSFLDSVASVRFLDLDPNSLRRPSIPGQTVLGDKGENLSSVLQAICADATAKESLLEWTRN